SDNRGLVDANGNASTTFNRLNGRVEIVLLGAKSFKYLDGDKFVGDVTKTGAENPKNYVVHPAFSAVRRTGYTKKADGNFGSTEEIPGFWVSKFEMTPGCTSKPNIASQIDMTVSNMFAEAKNIKTARGITGADSMLMTNTQWGAVAYLTKALGKEPAINASNKTGGGDYIANVNQSTTGNTTGVYDMSGCACESMSAYIIDLNNVHMENLKNNKDTKYVDVYAKGSNVSDKNSNYLANTDKYGDAQYEVSSNGDSSPMGWSGAYSYFPFLANPAFYHGGHYSHRDYAGVFAFAYNTGEANIMNGWRGVCII
ncbi:MAG: hypothetical protein RR702_07135, partial [Clostridia bacterium]